MVSFSKCGIFCPLNSDNGCREVQKMNYNDKNPNIFSFVYGCLSTYVRYGEGYMPHTSDILFMRLFKLVNHLRFLYLIFQFEEFQLFHVQFSSLDHKKLD